MRVIAGEWRGRKLAEPRGREVTRPTTDRVREACASMVESALDGGIGGSRVLDAFAALVRRNLEGVGCDRDRYRVSCADVLATAARGRVFGAPFDLVMIDAPYALGPEPACSLLESLAASGAIGPGALALVERSTSQDQARPADFVIEREKRYGLTSVDLLRLQPAAQD